MVKLFSMLKRRSGLSREEFLQYWREVHAPLAIKMLPGLKKYVQNHPVDMPEFESEIDGIAEVWFEDLEALRHYWSWRNSEEAKPLLEDEKKFSERSQWLKFFAEEHVIK